MKKFIVVILSLVLVLSLVACGGNSDTAQPDTTDAPAVTDASEVTPTGTDLSKVDYEVAYGDVEAMEALQQKVGNFEAENAVVKIDGELENFGSSFSIMERGEGTGIGLTVKVEGWSDADYPEYARVQILGVVVTEGWNHYISVLPENITVVSEN